MGRNLGPLIVMAGIVIAAWASWCGPVDSRGSAAFPVISASNATTCASTSRWSRCFWSRSRPAYCCPSRRTFSGDDAEGTSAYHPHDVGQRLGSGTVSGGGVNPSRARQRTSAGTSPSESRRRWSAQPNGSAPR